ncbi:hemagglutinin protein [Winogradskyella sp. ZXX205]|uniref:Hemagglutinin protein n=1 Tax=Winogradskyella ouciana TaxID=2608631 RepID=A0A7K1G9T5_9FLAO|nr:hemagglutinin protein [Winogradskyella ouciana]
MITGFICFGFSGQSQTIEKFSIDSGGASTTTGGIEVLYTLGEVHVQELNTASISVSEGFINSDLKIKIDPKLFLQGPSLNPEIVGLMNDNLRDFGYLPITSPYEDEATCNASVFITTGNDAIVDWVWVELRASNDNQKLINARSALLQRDGDVVGLDGISNLQMTASPQSYYVVVNHRNHLGAMTNTIINLNQTPILVDFTDSNLVTYGNNARMVLNSGALALWSGDTNNVNLIRFLGADSSISVIKDEVLADPSNGFESISYTSLGYFNTDLDLNGGSKYSGSGNDTNIVRDNILSHPSNGFGSPTYTIHTTVPFRN